MGKKILTVTWWVNKRDERLEAERALEYCFYGTEKGSSHRDGKKQTVWKNDFEK